MQAETQPVKRKLTHAECKQLRKDARSPYWKDKSQIHGTNKRRVDTQTETLAQQIRRKSNNLQEQVDLELAVSVGRSVYLDAEYNPADGARVPGTGTKFTPEWSDVQDAIKWLADRGYGKATQVMAGSEDGGAVQFMLVSAVPRTMAEIEAVEEQYLLTSDAASPTQLTEHDPE